VNKHLRWTPNRSRNALNHNGGSVQKVINMRPVYRVTLQIRTRPTVFLSSLTGNIGADKMES
jgi:hypothetical protein